MSDKIQKSTVTVSAAWYSSNPVFEDVLEAVRRGMADENSLNKEYRQALQELLPLNGGEAIQGNTECGPHTRIRFEAPSLAHGIKAAKGLEVILVKAFPEGKDRLQYVDFSCLSFRYAGLPIHEAIQRLESAALDARKDLKLSQRLFPSKKLQGLRVAIREIYS